MSDRFLVQLRADLLRMDIDDGALSNVLRVKKEVDALASSPLACNPDYQIIATLVKDVPPGEKCACCGKEGLVRICYKGGLVVGVECVKEDELGSCRRR